MEGSGSRRGGASGGYVSMSPSQTPRSSEKVARSFDNNGSAGGSSSRLDRDKGVNIQVVLRCRPLSQEEVRLGTPVVITCNDPRREVYVSQSIAGKQIDRTFIFDKVFGPKSKQKDVFNHAVMPLVNEVLEGYNCTIFAYGQTGTGKTYTMEGGGMKMQNGELPSDAGVIPRAVRKIFDILEAQNAEYSMKVSFLELYNEELTDLLAPEESKVTDDKLKKPMALMEDGKGGVFVRGLEEEAVSSASEIYKILDRGSSKRRTAETLLNKQSSRSHSIFSITIHIKECTPEGEELIRCGKLNLVDLAGSENISRSGAREGRAREAGEINKSLLTLGRVINSLVDHSGHIPYRESKLTRLLRDSLGGKTKTCIIATIAPSVHCVEETLGTLDYAHRAKNIKNKPEVNQKMMYSAHIKDLHLEMDRLKQELYAAREKNGVYIPMEQFLSDEAEKKALTEKLEQLETSIESKDKQYIELQELHDSQVALGAKLSDKLLKSQKKLEQTEHTLSDVEEKYRQATCTIKEKEYLVQNLLKSEKALLSQACDLRSELENAVADISGLFSKLDRKERIEDANRDLVQRFHSKLTEDLDLLHGTVSACVTQQEKHLKGLQEEVQSFVSEKCKATDELRKRVVELESAYEAGMKEVDSLAGQMHGNSQSTFQRVNSQVQEHVSSLRQCLEAAVGEADQLLSNLSGRLREQEGNLASFVSQQQERLQMTLETTRLIAASAAGFADTLDSHASELDKTLATSQAESNSQLSKLEKKFEECLAKEERHVLEMVAALLAESTARKRTMVQQDISSLKESTSKHTGELRAATARVHGFTASLRKQCSGHIDDAESTYNGDTVAVEHGRARIAEGLQHCKRQAASSGEQWSSLRASVIDIGGRHADSTQAITRDGEGANGLLRGSLAAATSAARAECGAASAGIVSSLDESLNMDHGMRRRVESDVVEPSLAGAAQLRRDVSVKTTEMTESSGVALRKEYAVDEPTCSTPRRRAVKLPSAQSIEELKSPPVEEMVKALWDGAGGKPAGVQAAAKLFASPAAGVASPECQRSPLAAIN